MFQLVTWCIFLILPWLPTQEAGHTPEETNQDTVHKRCDVGPLQDIGSVETCGILITTPSLDFPQLEMRCPSDLWQADGLASYPEPQDDVPPTEPTKHDVTEKTRVAQLNNFVLPYYL